MSLTDEQPAREDASRLLSEIAVETKLADIPDHTLQAARLDLLDTLGCALAGWSAMGVREIRELMIEQGGRTQATVWGTSAKIPASQAAFTNAIASHALDFDDNHPGVLHTGASVIPAALASAEAQSVSDLEEILAAIVVGTEVADRLATATIDGPGVSGWLLTPLCGYFGAAAASARIFQLDTDAAQSSIGFAYVQASGNGQSTLDGALGKRMQPGFAARGGVFATELAREGLTGPTNSLEGLRGYFNVYHQGRYLPEALRRTDATTWFMDDAMYKPYPCCGWTHSALECAVAIAKEGYRAEEVEGIEVGVNAQSYKSTGTPLPRRYTPKTPVDAQFSIPFVFATAFLNGGITLSDFADDALSRPDTLSLARLVSVSVDPELDATYGRTVSPARVVVTFRDGTKREHTVFEPLGWGRRRIGREFLEEKFLMCCREGGVAQDVAAELSTTILKGSGSGSAEHLTTLLSVSR
jgi:2-methylcitrate dehydratase PrpD